MDRLDRIEKLLEDSIRERKEAQRKTDEQIKELRESQKQTDKQLKDTDKRLKKTDEMLKRLSKKMNGFLGNYGEVAEEYFYRSLEEKMTLGNIKFDEIDRRVKYDNHSVEFDIMLFNGESVGIVGG